MQVVLDASALRADARELTRGAGSQRQLGNNNRNETQRMGPAHGPVQHGATQPHLGVQAHRVPVGKVQRIEAEQPGQPLSVPAQSVHELHVRQPPDAPIPHEMVLKDNVCWQVCLTTDGPRVNPESLRL